jgi:hypothetical protein
MENNMSTELLAQHTAVITLLPGEYILMAQ